MRELLLIGIGTGNPAHLTQEAMAAIREADLVLLPHKDSNKAELARVREDMLAALNVPAGRRLARVRPAGRNAVPAPPLSPPTWRRPDGTTAPHKSCVHQTGACSSRAGMRC